MLIDVHDQSIQYVDVDISAFYLPNLEPQRFVGSLHYVLQEIMVLFGALSYWEMHYITAHFVCQYY